MKIIADTHTHTIACSHAYSTVGENALAARERGLTAIAMTEHGPTIPDAPYIWCITNQHVVSRILHGVTILHGVEANIIDYAGHLDVEDDILKNLEWVIASYHQPCCAPADEKDHTSGYLAIARHPYVDVIGHSGTEAYRYDYEKGVKAFKEYGKIVEINEGSFRVRKSSAKNCAEIAKLCKKYEVPVVVNSDAHHASDIGRFDQSIAMLCEMDFPQHLILNADEDRFFEHILSKRHIDIVGETDSQKAQK